MSTKDKTPKEFAKELYDQLHLSDALVFDRHTKRLCETVLNLLIQQAMEVETEFSCGYADNAIRYYEEVRQELLKL